MAGRLAEGRHEGIVGSISILCVGEIGSLVGDERGSHAGEPAKVRRKTSGLGSLMGIAAAVLLPS